MATAMPALNQATYGHHGIVTILETSGSLSQIETETLDVFWVRTDKLKALRRPKVKPVPASAKQAETAPAVAPPESVAEVEAHILDSDPFISWLQTVTCKIIAKTPSQWLKKLDARYESATGQPLPSRNSGLTITENGRSWSYSLQVQFPKPDSLPLPSTAHARRDKPGYYYISNNAYVFELLALGFKLGRNRPRISA